VAAGWEGALVMSVAAPIEVVDLEELVQDEVPCQWDPCLASAEWIVRCTTCLIPVFVCGKHRRAADEWIGPFRPYCVRCSADFPKPIPWRPV
jgi:Zn-finger protein